MYTVYMVFILLEKNEISSSALLSYELSGLLISDSLC